jgi:hypothetical protein
MTLRGRQLVAGVVIIAVLGLAAAVILSRDYEAELVRAVRDGDLELVRELLAEEPWLANGKVLPPGSRTGRLRVTWEGRYMIHDALGNRSMTVEILDALTAAGADLTVQYRDRTLLHHAAAGGNLQATEWLLGKGADPDGRVECVGCPEHGQTPLHLADGVDMEEKIALLLARGADPELADAVGRRALHVVAERGNTEMAWLLCAHGADPSARDAQGRTPFDIAREMDAKGRSALSRFTEVTGAGEVSDWFRPGGSCEKLSAAARATGAPVPEEKRLAVYRAFACGRGVSNACAAAR